ncbi:hypothetical protein EJB05_36380 [Eragrostis curvula]|nr:hypothetical protein EJB05_36380 [Eragrostis curvula]
MEEQTDIAMNQQGISPLLGEGRHNDYSMLQQLSQRQLIGSIRDLLKNDRYLIVVDDIWEISTWEFIEKVFVKNDPDSRIMATTRNFHVAKKIGEVYHGNRLSYEESKELFFKRVCGSYVKVELEKESEKILKKCDGVPLTIITVASVLARRPISDWSTVYNSIGFSKSKDGSVEDMKRIITFSYYDLPPHLKTCLMYLSIFVEDRIIGKNHLIWLWIAEGFVKEKDHKGLFEVGEEYFHELKNSSMILAFRQITGAWSCRVHDMVLQIIRDLSLEENLVTIFDYNKHKVPSKRKVRRMVLHGSWDDDVDPSPQVRSFVASGCPMPMTDPLKNFIVLRVLSLEGCSGMKDHHLEHLGNLLHLRYFGLKATPTKKLPDNIERLQFLQTLEIRGTGIKQLPENMSRLTKLMCLNADKETSVPSWIGNMTSLQELTISVSDSEAGASFARLLAKELGNLTELRVLRIVIKDVQNDQVQEVESALTESLSKLHKAREIMIVFFDKNNLTHRFTTPWVVSLSTQLRILAIVFFLPRLPECIHPGNLPFLSDLVMCMSVLEQRDIEILGSFPELSSLLMHIIGTKTIACGSGGFKNLLYYKGSWPLIFSRGAMPMLETYELDFKVSELKNGEVDFNFECGLGNLPSLRVVKVRLWCEFAHPDEVEEAEAALRHATDVHPNRPVFQLTKSGEAKMLLTENKRREYFAAWRLKRQAIVESQISAQLIREFKLVRDSVPSCHPNAPKLNSLMKECEDFMFDFALSQCEERYDKLMNYDIFGLDRHQLMDAIEFMKPKIEVRSRSNQQAAALVRELKAERALQVVSLDHPAEAVEISRLFQQLDDHWNVSLARMEEFSRVHDSAPLCHPNQWDLRTKKIFAVLFDHDFNLHHRDVMSAALECTEDIQQLMESIAALKLMIEMRAHRTQQAAALLEELKADLNLQSGDDGADKIPKSSILPTEEG